MRTVVIFAFAIAALIAASSAAPSARKWSHVPKLASMFVAKFRQGQKATKATATAVLSRDSPNSEVIDQAIKTTRALSSSLARFHSNRHQMDQEASGGYPAEWQKAQDFVNEYGTEVWEHIGNAIFNVWWFGHSDEEIRAEALRAVNDIEATIAAAVQDFMDKEDWNMWTSIYMYGILFNNYMLFRESTSEIAEMWALIKPDSKLSHVQFELDEAQFKEALNSVLVNPNKVRDFLGDVRDQAVQTLDSALHAFIALLQEYEIAMTDFMDRFETTIDYYHAVETLIGHAIQFGSASSDLWTESYDSDGSEEQLAAVVDKVMSRYEEIWAEIVLEFQAEMSADAIEVMTTYSTILYRFGYRVTAAMDPLVSLISDLW